MLLRFSMSLFLLLTHTLHYYVLEKFLILRIKKGRKILTLIVTFNSTYNYLILITFFIYANFISIAIN